MKIFWAAAVNWVFDGSVFVSFDSFDGVVDATGEADKSATTASPPAVLDEPTMTTVAAQHGHDAIVQ